MKSRGESFKKESVLSHVRCFTRTEEPVVTVMGDACVFSVSLAGGRAFADIVLTVFLLQGMLSFLF